METETSLFSDALTWGVPIAWGLVALFAFRNGFRISAALISLSALLSFLQPVVFYAGYSLPSDWQTQEGSLTFPQWVAWANELLFPVIGFLALLLGYVLAIRRRT